MDLTAFQAHGLFAASIVNRNARGRAADAFSHQPTRHLHDMARPDPAAGGAQHLNGFFVIDAYAHGFEDVQACQVDFLDLFIGQQAIARDHL